MTNDFYIDLMFNIVVVIHNLDEFSTHAEFIYKGIKNILHLSILYF